jgi:hypothetical protein
MGHGDADTRKQNQKEKTYKRQCISKLEYVFKCTDGGESKLCVRWTR